ncbi:MAG TPA: transcription-repair coupling factor [Burkholderiales bacterium]|nr:transcription-repair coupling factor [Burkholderiales bacterium]
MRYANLHGSADALALAELAARQRPLIVLTASALDAQRLLGEIRYFAPQLKTHLLPDWETLPYDSFSPHQDLVSERLETLYQIMQLAFDVAFVPVSTALYRLAPVEYLAAHTFFVSAGSKLAIDALRHQLTLAGYSHVTQVVSPGEYCVRGGLIDLFPSGSALPYRIDLVDDEIETLRTFDVDTQRSIYKVNEVRLLPAREFPLDEDARSRFRRNFREKFEGDPSKSALYKDVSKGIAPAGIEYYLPLFFDHTATLVDYLPDDATLALHGEVEAAALQFWRDTGARFELLRGDHDHPLLPPSELFLTADALFGAIKRYPRIEISAAVAGAVTASPALPPREGGEGDSGPSPVAAGSSAVTRHSSPVAADAPLDAQHSSSISCATAALPPVQVERRADNPLAKLRQFIDGFDGRVLLLAESLGRRETMHEYFREYGFDVPVCADWAAFNAAAERVMLGVAPLAAGFALTEVRTALVTENELYAAQVRSRAARDEARRSSPEGMLRDLSEVRIGDPVVHEAHGIGRYLGLVNLDLGEGATEFLALEYAGGDKLYVPVAQLHLIARYSGGPPETVQLNTLGTPQWERAKRRAAQQVRDTAVELLNLYALRAARHGHSFSIKQHEYEAFCEDFPFEETPDQAAAISAVIEDLRSGQPMDRLICGDVGFGKTEVALRAAFIALMDGKQVAVLVPTTLLAEQHFNNFSDRFADWPVRIAELSRFRSAREQARTLDALAAGGLDIVIGTHRLLQKDVRFKNLGLVIIDEEHRFGVRQKERLKALRAEVDVLTLTATPIPRTLAMSLEGLREFSVIATAPQRRLAIRTFVARHSPGLVREAALRELKRGGQVFFLHNDIDTIARLEGDLARLLPEARIRIAHGQMRERELEHVMRDFYQQRFNLLLCTTIIETGIDIPTANTIIIDRADKFGLAQLHQLRGRVGRSHHQAYAYLLIPDEGAIGAQARKRLEAIQLMEELGAGFYLAMHDLEIRGAGEVLGESQSGEMQAIGFTLYASMLDAAVRSLKQGREPDLSAPLGVTTEINLHAPALLPEAYCSDVNERLVLYKRLANCETLEQLDALYEELIDRFGLAPPPAQVLIDTHRLRILAKPLGVARIDAGAEQIQLQFVPDPPIDGRRIIQLVQTRRDYRLAGPDRLKVSARMPQVGERIATLKGIFRELGAP